MILYKLRCSHDHEFEAWFRNGASYDRQVKSGDVDCPFCGDLAISKSPMAPRLAKSPSTDGFSRTSGADMAEAVSAAEQAAEKATKRTVGGDGGHAVEVAEQILKAVNMLRDYVERNYENVGDDFADEARRIHYGDAEERGICGNASDEESKALVEEGVEHVRLPGTPRKSS